MYTLVAKFCSLPASSFFVLLRERERERERDAVTQEGERGREGEEERERKGDIEREFWRLKEHSHKWG